MQRKKCNRKKNKIYRSKETREAYFYIAPYLIVVLAFLAYLLLRNIAISVNGFHSPTLRNYWLTIKDPLFLTINFNTLIWVVGCVSLQLLFAGTIALLLNIEFKGNIFFRILILALPWATPDVVTAVSWKWMYNDMYGVINDILQKLGLIKFYLPWLGDSNLAKIAVIIANVWKGFAISGMIYLAGLKTIPREFYEAAEIDGASVWKKLIHVTLPSMRSIILTTVLLTVMWTFNYFPLIYIMTGGGPSNATDTVVTYSYRQAFWLLDFGRATALSTTAFIILLIVAIFYTRVLMKERP